MSTRMREGTYFLLPVESGQFGVGLVTRAPRRGGVLLGYFFGPRRTTAPTREWLESRVPPQAVLVARFRDQALFRGEWKVLHTSDAFQREAWPVPAFHRFDGSITATPGATTVTDWRIQYADDNLIMPADERPATGADLRLREDTVYDAASLCREVGAWLTAAVPSADDSVWR
jgi:Immunity protein 26